MENQNNQTNQQEWNNADSFISFWDKVKQPELFAVFLGDGKKFPQEAKGAFPATDGDTYLVYDHINRKFLYIRKGGQLGYLIEKNIKNEKSPIIKDVTEFAVKYTGKVKIEDGREVHNFTLHYRATDIRVENPLVDAYNYDHLDENPNDISNEANKANETKEEGKSPIVDEFDALMSDPNFKDVNGSVAVTDAEKEQFEAFKKQQEKEKAAAEKVAKKATK